MFKKDCFAYCDGGCNALKSICCDGCKFYKTEKQNEDEKAECFNRNLKLGLVNGDNVYYKVLEGRK